MVMPYHRAIDRAREARAGKRAIGTTGFGIGPAYEDKMARVGLRFDELNNFARFSEKLDRNVADKNLYLRAVLKAKPLKGPEIVDQMKRVRARMLPYLCDTGAYLAEAVDAGKRVLFEGAHGTMLDIDHGTYPFVTSSNCIASAVFSGAPLAPGNLDAVLGISKAYTTRVGAGPFPIGNQRRARQPAARPRARSSAARPAGRGGSDGSTRCSRAYAVRLNGMWGLALTKLDVLTGIDPLRICVAYQLGAKRYDEMPPGRATLESARAGVRGDARMARELKRRARVE